MFVVEQIKEQWNGSENRAESFSLNIELDGLRRCLTATHRDLVAW
jgi:hypothetical protein